MAFKFHLASSYIIYNITWHRGPADTIVNSISYTVRKYLLQTRRYIWEHLYIIDAQVRGYHVVDMYFNIRVLDYIDKLNINVKCKMTLDLNRIVLNLNSYRRHDNTPSRWLWHQTYYRHDKKFYVIVQLTIIFSQQILVHANLLQQFDDKTDHDIYYTMLFLLKWRSW